MSKTHLAYSGTAPEPYKKATDEARDAGIFPVICRPTASGACAASAVLRTRAPSQPDILSAVAETAKAEAGRGA